MYKPGNMEPRKVIVAGLCVVSTMYIILSVNPFLLLPLSQEPIPQPQQPRLSHRKPLSRKGVGLTEHIRHLRRPLSRKAVGLTEYHHHDDDDHHLSLCREEYLSQDKVRPVYLNNKGPKATGTMKDMERVHKKRIERVEAVCEKYKISHQYSVSPTEIWKSFIFDTNNGFAWCKNAKVVRNFYKSLPRK